MNKNTVGAIGLSVFLLFGAAPTLLLAHGGRDHEGQRGGYGSREDSNRYDPQYDDDRWEDEDEDAYRRSSRRYPPPDWERSAPRERSDRSW